MKQPVLLTLSLAAAIALAACGKGEEPAAAEATPAAKSLLAHVPSDTPYLAANLQPMPEAVIDAHFRRAEPVLAELQTQLSNMKTEMDTGASMTGDEAMDRLLLALVDEFDGKLSREGLHSLGWDLQSSSVFYGEGAFPVGRIALTDPSVLRATIQRILDNAEIEAPELEFQGVSYWRVTAEDTSEVPVGLYVSILSDHMAAGFYPLAAEADFLPSFLGLELPAESNAAEFLADLNRKRGYTPYGTAHLDLHRLADEFMDPEARTARTMMSISEYDLEDFSAQCAEEMHGIIDNFPAMNMGVTELEPNVLAYEALIESPASLASELTALVSAIPAARSLRDRMIEFAFGIRVGAVRDFLRQKAQGIVDDPYQCEHFADLNRQAEEALVKLDQPLPPFVNNFRGLRLSLKEIVPGPNPEVPIPSDVKGYVAVHVEQPEMFVGMAQMFLPDLSDLNLAPGEPPVRVPDSLVTIQGIVAYAAMSSEALGLSAGDGEEAGLIDFLEMEKGPEGQLMSVDYDVAAYNEYQLKALETTEAGKQNSGVTNVSRAALEAARDAGDRNHVTVTFTPGGLLVRSRVTYKY